MVQRHSLILWKKAESKEKSFEEISKEAYDSFIIFQDYPRELKPNYLTVKIRYSISFFFSMNEKDSCAFQMNVGNKNDKFYNTFIMDLPLSCNLYNKKTADIIRNLFEKLVQSFMPFWGCISNKTLSRKYGKLLEGNLPTTVHWMNYWSEDIIRTIGMEKIRKMVDENSGISLQSL